MSVIFWTFQAEPQRSWEFKASSSTNHYRSHEDRVQVSVAWAFADISGRAHQASAKLYFQLAEHQGENLMGDEEKKEFEWEKEPELPPKNFFDDDPFEKTKAERLHKERDNDIELPKWFRNY